MEQEIRNIIDRMKGGHEIKHPDAFRCQEIWAGELEEVLDQYVDEDSNQEP